MRDLSALVTFWTGAPKPSPEGFRIIAARSILAAKEALRENFPVGMVHDPVVEILLSVFIAGANTGQISLDAICTATGLAQTTGQRWIAALEGEGLIHVTKGAGGTWIALTDRGFADTSRAIDAVLARQALILG